MERSINKENQLLQLLTKGDPAAFEELFHLYKDKLYTFILQLGGNPTLAEDVVQEVFLKLWRDREALSAVDNFNAYLFRMAQNHAINVLRRQSRENLILADLQRLSIQKSQAGEALSAKEVQHLLQQAVNNLPPQQRRVFELSRNEEMKYEEIAGQLGISPATVRNHMVQALKAIREFIRTTYTRDLLCGFFLLLYY